MQECCQGSFNCLQTPRAVLGLHWSRWPSRACMPVRDDRSCAMHALLGCGWRAMVPQAGNQPPFVGSCKERLTLPATWTGGESYPSSLAVFLVARFGWMLHDHWGEHQDGFSDIAHVQHAKDVELVAMTGWVALCNKKQDSTRIIGRVSGLVQCPSCCVHCFRSTGVQQSQSVIHTQGNVADRHAL